MSLGSSPAFSSLYASLSKHGPIKTWSLIVTIFGDLAPEAGAKLDSQFLGAICDVFEIKPEALRVALHRLRKDGWLEAEKQGRRTANFLSNMGRQTTADAYHRIYREPVREPALWHIRVADIAETPHPDAVVLGPNCHVSAIAPCGFGFSARYEDVPDWMKTGLCSARDANEFQNLARVFEPLRQEPNNLNPAQILCLRLLALHYWRRLLLRLPDAPELLLGQDWFGFEARCAVCDVFNALQKPTVEEIADVFLPPNA